MPVNYELPKLPENQEDKPKLNTSLKLINNVTFFGDSAIPEGDPIYESVFNLAKFLAQKNMTIIDGGGPGIMKAATDGAESVGGKTVAVYWQPKLASFFEGRNLANIADETHSASNYIIRTFGLIEKGDAYIVCKGGSGTISEFGLVWALAKLYYGRHKPVILFGDFWDTLIEAFQKSMYIDETELGVLYRATTPEQVYKILEEHELKIKRSVLKQVTGDEAAFILGQRGQIAQTYNRVAQAYHSEHAGKLVAQSQLDEFIANVNPPAQVLDIGCGPGFDTKYLAEKYSVTGIEISKKFADIATFENPNSDIIHADVVTYDLGQNKYKGVWTRDALHHIDGKELDGVFKKIQESLVENGIFYVIVREGEGEFNDVEKKKYGKIERFYHLFTTEELTERAQKAGFELVKIDHIQRSHKWLAGMFKKKI